MTATFISAEGPSITPRQLAQPPHCTSATGRGAESSPSFNRQHLLPHTFQPFNTCSAQAPMSGSALGPGPSGAHRSLTQGERSELGTAGEDRGGTQGTAWLQLILEPAMPSMLHLGNGMTTWCGAATDFPPRWEGSRSVPRGEPYAALGHRTCGKLSRGTEFKSHATFYFMNCHWKLPHGATSSRPGPRTRCGLSPFQGQHKRGT